MKSKHLLPLASLALIIVFGVSGFTLRPDIDRSSQKNLPNYNNAGLNSARVTPTEFTVKSQLAAKLTRSVPGIRNAVVLCRGGALFVGISTDAKPHTVEIVMHASNWLKQQSKAKVYVSSDETLFNHFYRYAADRAEGLPIGSDIVITDIERIFPGVDRTD